MLQRFSLCSNKNTESPLIQPRFVNSVCGIVNINNPIFKIFNSESINQIILIVMVSLLDHTKREMHVHFHMHLDEEDHHDHQGNADFLN